jgi:filamentous hemagglutinin
VNSAVLKDVKGLVGQIVNDIEALTTRLPAHLRGTDREINKAAEKLFKDLIRSGLTPEQAAYELKTNRDLQQLVVLEGVANSEDWDSLSEEERQRRAAEILLGSDIWQQEIPAPDSGGEPGEAQPYNPDGKTAIKKAGEVAVQVTETVAELDAKYGTAASVAFTGIQYLVFGAAAVVKDFVAGEALDALLGDEIGEAAASLVGGSADLIQSVDPTVEREEAESLGQGFVGVVVLAAAGWGDAVKVIKRFKNKITGGGSSGGSGSSPGSGTAGNGNGSGSGSNSNSNSQNGSGNQGADNAVTSGHLNKQLTAEQIGAGHAFEKHVVSGEFDDLGITNVKQFQDHIEDVLNNPSDIRYARDGRTFFVHEETRTVVVHNPAAPDGGTAFRPDDWNTFIGSLPSRNEPF